MSAKLPDRISSLDGLRALSFFIVFVSHAGLTIAPGGFGVTVFFFLSGFLITTLMRVEFESSGTVHFGNFYLRRALRILPPFYLVLLGALLVMLIYPGEQPLSMRALVAQALHLSNYWVIFHGEWTLPVGTSVYWSLAVEEHFYLMFPLLYLLMQRSRLSARDQALALWSLCGLVLLWRCVLVYGAHVSAERTFLGTDTRIDSILFGCALAVWKNPVLDGASGNERLWKWSLVPAALLALGLGFIELGDAFRETFRYSVQGIALTVIFIAAIRYEKWIAFRWLNTRPMIFLGTLSYSLYLIHDAALVNIARLNPGLARPVVAALALALSIGVAWLLYETVEKPCARARKRLLMRARKPLAPEAPPRTASAERPSSRRAAAPGSADTRWA